jgi:hypothetical protein
LPSAGAASSSSSLLRFSPSSWFSSTTSCLSAVIIAPLTSVCFMDIVFLTSSVMWPLRTELYLLRLAHPRESA